MEIGGTLLVLVIAAGLNGPLAICALLVAMLNGLVPLRSEFAWLQSPWMLVFAMLLLLMQLCADLYFVPATVKDRRYLHGRRVHYAYLHARTQSLFRPLCAALIAAAMFVPVPDWRMALAGFCGATATYWLSAWIREYVAQTRGTLVLVALETAKNVALVPLVVLAFAAPLVALVLAVAMLGPTAWWTAQLQREFRLYAPYGGQRASEDA